MAKAKYDHAAEKWSKLLEECAARPEFFGELVKRFRVVNIKCTQDEFSSLMFMESRVPICKIEKAKEVNEISTDSLVRLRLFLDDFSSNIPGKYKRSSLGELVEVLSKSVRSELRERRSAQIVKSGFTSENFCSIVAKIDGVSPVACLEERQGNKGELTAQMGRCLAKA